MSMVVISFIYFAITLIGSMGIFFDNSRTTVNIRILSVLFFFIGLILLVVLGLLKLGLPTVIISSGIILLLYILIGYSIAKSKQ